MVMFHRHASHEHDHRHEHEAVVGRPSARPLLVAFGITALFTVIELLGGLLANSLALLADAGHMASDVAALALALLALWLARQPATPQRSYGLYRAEVLVALLNGASLLAISGVIAWEAVQRLQHPPEVKTGLMLGVAVAGMVANGLVGWILSRGGVHHHNLNIRGALLHVLSDFLGSLAAIVAAGVMWVTGWYWADPVLSLAIGALVLWSAWQLVRESVDVLLEATPRHLDLDEVRTSMEAVPGVEAVHDLHIWTLTSGVIALSSHVEVRPGVNWPTLLARLAHLLRERFGIVHVTLQPEAPAHHPEPFRGCTLESPDASCACLAPIAGGNHTDDMPSVD